MKDVKKVFFKALSCFGFILLLNVNRAAAQVCSGSWASSTPLSYDCITGEWIGSTNPDAEPPGCPQNPVFTAAQANTFTFSNPVGGFTIDFNAFSSATGCARMEIKIDGVFYPLTAANFVDLPASSGCTGGSFSYMALTPDGYITSSPVSLLNSNGQARIIIDGINATSVTISTNDGAGSVFTNPFNCLSVMPIELKSFTGIATAGCKAMLSWESGTESNIKNIEILRSADGVRFEKVTDVLPKGSDSKYVLSTGNPSDAYFRLKINDLDGNYEYSDILKVKANCSVIGYSLFPNPARSTIAVTGLKQDDKVFVLDMLGRVVIAFNSPVNNNNFDIQQLASGTYNLQVIGLTGIKSNLKFVKN